MTLGLSATRHATGERAGRELNFTEIHEGTHTRQGMMAGGTFCATLSQDRYVAGVRAIGRPESSRICAQVVPHRVPLLTDDARQFGRGRVCACPYQGASCGCRLRSGATRVSIRPAPQARPGRSAIPVRPIARRAPLSPNHPSGRANSSVAPEPAHSRSASTSGGLSSRRSILPTVEGGRSLRLSLLRQSPNFAAQHIAQLLKSSVPLACRHARERRRSNVEALRQIVEGLRNGHE